MSKFGVVTSELEILGDVSGVDLFSDHTSAIEYLINLVEVEQEITLSPMDKECILDNSQYITNNEKFGYTVVVF